MVPLMRRQSPRKGHEREVISVKCCRETLGDQEDTYLIWQEVSCWGFCPRAVSIGVFGAEAARQEQAEEGIKSQVVEKHVKATLLRSFEG